MHPPPGLRVTVALVRVVRAYDRGMSEGMSYAHLGRSGVLVSRIGLGTMDFGFLWTRRPALPCWTPRWRPASTTLTRPTSTAVRSRRTWQKGYGVSEEVIGRWLRQSGRRDDIVLATKVYQPMGLGPNDRRLSAYHIRRACEASLRRLQTDHIDLYQMHHVDRSTPWEEIWQAMEQLVREGKITYVGSSNFAAWDVALAQSAASARHFVGLTSEQCLYNLAVRTVELELIPALRALGIGLIAYSPLHAGLLAGALAAAEQGGVADEASSAESRRTETSSQPTRGCAGRSVRRPRTSPWPGCCSNPVVSTAIVGARTPDELRSDLGALSLELDIDVVDRLAHIWPGPGEAPQAYAW